MNNEIRIERAVPEDAAKLLRIYAPYVLRTAITFEEDVPSEEEFAERIRTISAKYPYIKAVRGSEILGYAYAGTFKGRKCYDWSVETTIYVDENAKGQGIGKILYEELEKSCLSMGLLNLNACIALPDGEDPYVTEASCRFHEFMGYRSVGVFHRCASKFGRWYNMTWMEKPIGPHETEPAPVRFGEWTLGE